MAAIRKASALLAGLMVLALALISPPAGRAQKKEKAIPPAPTEVVWPGPPTQPRIRFLESIAASEDVTGKKKRSFVEKLAGTSPVRDQLRLLKPYGVAVDAAGRIYVADAQQRAVLVFDRGAHAVTSWKGNAQFPMALPIGLVFDQDGRLFVSDSFADQVLVFNPGGNPIAGFGKDILKRPGGMAVDAQRGRLYVADPKLNQVLIFDTKTYKLLKTIGGVANPGSGELGKFSGVTNVALDSAGRLYVTDTFNCRVQVFEADGRFVRSFGEQGTQPGKFVRPKGIALDSEGHVYVVDAAFNNFQILTSEGKPLLFVGSGGDQPGQFLLPAGIFIDRNDRLYVTEQRVSGGRLQIFQYLGEKSSFSKEKKVN